MGKPTGFLEYQRELPRARPPLERVRDWGEFHGHAEPSALRRQGARCMDCGIPFCHTGRLLAGMASGCPLQNLIPEWNDLVYRDLWKQALERLERTNDFPEITGRVCPAPCEASCTLGLHSPAVTIKAIEHAIAERGFAEGWIRARPPRTRTGKMAAVVGSGPAGLAAAAELNRAGHTVTVFERSDRPGGLLLYGIPNMKLEKRVLERRIDLLREEGIRFVTNADVGRSYPARRLLEEFDATILAIGAGRPRDLAVEGRELRGVHFAMEYLTEATKALMAGDPAATPVSARGRDAVVIGGGDTGTDCVATAIRQGCRSLVQIEILPRPPLERAPDNPWPEWPKVYRMDYGQEEAAALFGADPRVYETTVKAFLGDAEGRLAAIRTVGVRWEKDARGRPVPREVPGTEREIPAQIALLALGFLGPEPYLLDELGVERDERSNAKAEFGAYATNVPGVFVAGDARRGQSLVVWAIQEGRGAARACGGHLARSIALP